MANENYSKRITDMINKFLTEDDWVYTFDKEKGLFMFDLGLKGKIIKKLSFVIDVEEDEYMVIVTSPLGADENDQKMMGSMAEFLCLVNHRLKCGCFDMDMKDGEIRYKVFVDCSGITPSLEQIKNSIYCPAAMFKRYKMGIVDIILNNASAKTAYTQCIMEHEQEFREFISRELSSGDLVDAMLERLDEKIRIADEDLRMVVKNRDDPEEVETEIVTELFNEGGNAE